jgi:hypothetical protein
MYRYNPPFVCAELDEFWSYKSEHQQNILQLKAVIEEKFGGALVPFVKWGCPMYCIKIKGKYKPVCHFIYLRQGKTKKLLFHFGFFQGYKMFDYNGLFEPTKMSMIRGIPITELDSELTDMIVEYIQQAIDLRLEN